MSLLYHGKSQSKYRLVDTRLVKINAEIFYDGKKKQNDKGETADSRIPGFHRFHGIPWDSMGFH